MKKRVAILPFPGIENAYILVSGKWKGPDKILGSERYCKPFITFLYDAGNFAAEWEPEYGPIQIWEKTDGSGDSAEHYYFDYVKKGFGNWSQLAVEENNLPRLFVEGDYAAIFGVLREWAESRVQWAQP